MLAASVCLATFGLALSALLAKAAARSFRNKLGPDADRKIWQMAINILEETILLGRHDGIGDVMAAAERLERAKPPLVSAVVWG